MTKRILAGLFLVLLFTPFAWAQPPAPGGGRVVAPSTPSFALTASKAGTGTGTVTAAGITCGSDCSESYFQNTVVFLFASASVGSTFSGWSGDCSGTGSCSVTMSAAKSVTATFNLTAVASCDFYASPTGSASNDGLSTSFPFRPADFWGLGQSTIRGRTLCLMDGTYQGSAFMITPTPGITGTSSQIITVRALNDGGVFIDGQFARVPVQIHHMAYWLISGIDAGNSNNDTLYFFESSNITIQRSCFSNAGNHANSAVVDIYNSDHLVLEDVCVFGTGRNMWLTFNADSRIAGPPTGFNPTVNNTYRRIWSRSEGWNGTGTGQQNVYNMQPEYYQYGDSSGIGANPVSGNELYENIILVHGQGIQTLACDGGCNEVEAGISRRWTSLPVIRKGIIAYAASQTAFDLVNFAWIREDGATTVLEAWVSNYTDVFVDARTQQDGQPFRMTCNAAVETSPGKCAQNSADRLTGIRDPVTPASTFSFANTTNTNDCTSLAACPNFYTGSTPGIGARNCFEYLDGTLTGTKLWPWRMDDRIKAALARAAAAGTGGTALTGSAGTGYAAATVTSEIVSRYGPVPAACLR